MERGPIGITKVSGLLSKGYDQCFSCALLALAGALVFFLAAGTNHVFADSALQHAQDAPAAIQGGNSYTRQISDSVAMSSYFDNPGSRAFASRTIARGISDGFGVASEFGSPASQQAASSAAPRGYGPSLQPQSQRMDERFGKKILLGNKGDSRIYNTVVAQSGTPSAEMVSSEAGEMDFQETATLGDGGSDPDGNSSRLTRAVLSASRSSAAMQGMLLYFNATFGVYSFAIVAMAVGKSPQLARARRKTVNVGAGRVLVLPIHDLGGARFVVVIVVTIAVTAALSTMGPAVGQAYADNAASKIEVSSAYHLDADRKLISDIYQDAKNLDGSWSEEISDGQYVRITFEQSLGSANDITIYPRVVSGTPKIEVYEFNGNKLIAEFASINSNEYNKVYLVNLSGSQKTFDLQVVGGSVQFDHILDPQAIPTYVGAGTSASGTATITPALPSGLQTNDILLLFVETANEASSISNQNGGTWTEVTNSPQGTGATLTGTRLTMFWSRYNGSQGNPTVADAGDHQLAIILAFRGVITTGNPWDATSGNTDGTTSSSLSATGATTSIGNSLVVVAAAIADSTSDFGATWTNNNLASITNRVDVSTVSGNGGRLGVVTGQFATAGTYGATTNTLSLVTTAKGMMTIALLPPPSLLSGTPSDSLTVSSSVVAKVTKIDPDETIMITDQPVATVLASRSTSDTLTVSDSPAATVLASRSTSDTLTTTDHVVASVETHAMSDQLVVTDTVSIRTTQVVNDGVQVTDTLATAVNHAVGDSVSISDSVKKSVTRSLMDAISASDQSAGAVNAAHRTDDNLTIQDKVSTSVTRNLSDAIVVTDSARNAAHVINIADSFGVSDTAKDGTLAVHIGDALEVTATIGATPHAIHILDSLQLSEQLGTGTPYRGAPSELLAVTDGLAIKLGKLIPISDTLAAAEEITDVSIHWNRSFGENFDLQDCTPFSCAQVVHFSEGMSLVESDFFTSPPGRILQTPIVVTDAITVNRPHTFISLNDSVAVSAAFRPLLSLLVSNSSTNSAAPAATEHPGVVSWDGTPAQIRDTLGLAPLYFNSTVDRNDLPNQVVTLLPHHATFTPTAQLPGSDAIVSDWAGNLPANVPVQMPVSFQDTPALADHSDFVNMMNLQWTPNDQTSNFGLVVSVVDAPPNAAPTPSGELSPIYLDIGWWGDFSGGRDLSMPSYYQSLPKLTFVINNDWANQQQVARDANGVPDLKLWVLDDLTHQWTQITSIVKPTQSVDGTYTFVATLPHFSDYALTASRATTPAPSHGSSSSGGGPAGPVQEPLPFKLAVNLAESLGMSDSQKSAATGESGQKLKVAIADSLAVLTRPLSYKTFQVGDVDVKITVQDVKQESVVPPKAAATFLVEMANSGNKGEKFALNFWYYDEAGKKWESSQAVELGPYESKQVMVSVPFTSPGVFEVTAEARSSQNGDLINTTQLTVTVPWLTVNLYIVVVVAVAIIGISGAGIALLFRRRPSW